MDVVDRWTKRLALVLQEAMRETNEDFAAFLGVAPRTVAKWHENPNSDLRPNTQRMLDTALKKADESAQRRFALLIGEHRTTSAAESTAGQVIEARSNGVSVAEHRLAEDPQIGAALGWLDGASGSKPGVSRRLVADRAASLDAGAIADRGHRRSRVTQAQMAAALDEYYGDSIKMFRYGASCDGQKIRTSVLTKASWLPHGLALGAGHEHVRFTAEPEPRFELDEISVGAAVQRLAETVTAGTRMVNAPIYRLLTIDIDSNRISGSVGLTSFISYACTLDLLENELIDALAAGASATQGNLPLRDRYLPTLASVSNAGERLCGGGVLALCAIARPGSRARGGAGDYMLLVQERSGQVLNAARRLAVIPKAFHEPLVDYVDDAQFFMTLEREMEEELFGRDDVDSVIDGFRAADPMHPSRLSLPMRWLVDNPSSWRMECTGFGFNLVSGNFECAALIVIEDEAWWTQFGGQITANWESEGLRRYSSQDRETIAALLADPAWSNEGLFAATQGIRRLSEIGGRRVNLPTIEPGDTSG